MRKTSKGKLISCDVLWSADHIWTYSPPKTRWEKYEEKLNLGYLLKNSAEKTEDMIYIYNMSWISLQKPWWGKFEIWHRILPH